MLQINTGKLFSREVEHRNQLRGVIYSNVQLPYQSELKTAAGTLKSTGPSPADTVLVYELEEKIEKHRSGKNIVVSYTVKPYLTDFCALASFGFKGIFVPDSNAVRPLTDERPGAFTGVEPRKVLKRVFDSYIHLSDEELEEFESFVARLLALERRSYLGAMKAIHTFVAAVLRIRERPAEAYTMFVSAVEALAQDFDGFEANWDDMPHDKREAIDGVLSKHEDIATEVRAAILSTEHLALSRRYRSFVLSHLDDHYFRHRSQCDRQVARYEIDTCLRKAYSLRSSQVHKLSNLPDEIFHAPAGWEVTQVDRRATLTIQGLYNLTHQVICSFIRTEPTTVEESYNYTLELSGVTRMQMAPQYWVHRAIDDSRQASRKFEGLCSLVQSAIQNPEKSVLVDMREAIAAARKILPQAPSKHRPALIWITLLFDFMVTKELKSPDHDTFLKKYWDEALKPSPEALISLLLLRARIQWETTKFGEVVEQYFRHRVRRDGIQVSRTIEIAMRLALAERYRSIGSFVRAREQIVLALEIDPGNPKVAALTNHCVAKFIDWPSLFAPDSTTSD